MFRFLLLPLDIPFFCFGKRISAIELCNAKENVHSGDIILCTDRLFPIWQLMVKIVGGSRYSHAGIYVGERSVIEATTYHADGSCVAITNIDTFLNGYKSVCIIRPPYSSYAVASEVVEYTRRQLGKPYDYKLDFNDNDTVYCTKLVAKAIEVAGIATPTTNCCGRQFYMPDSFLHITGATVVYLTKTKYCMGAHIPFVVSHIVLFALMLLEILSLTACTLAGITAVLLYAAAGWIQYTNFKTQISRFKVLDFELGTLNRQIQIK